MYMQTNTLIRLTELMADSRPYKQVVRAQAQQRTRQALMDAALAEFFEGHWERASLTAMAKRAGVTKQTLLRHFGSKDGLLMAAMAAAGSDAYQQRFSTPQGDVAGAVENLLSHYEQWGQRSLRIGAWLQTGTPILAQMSRAARQMHYNWVEYAFGPQLQQLRGDSGERERVRAALIALCDVQVWWLYHNDLQLDHAQIHAILTMAIARVLGESGEREG
jgi:AcrR family transcriptional regulator